MEIKGKEKEFMNKWHFDGESTSSIECDCIMMIGGSGKLCPKCR